MTDLRLAEFETIFKTEPLYCKDSSNDFDELDSNWEIGYKCANVFFRNDSEEFSVNCRACNINFSEFTSFTLHYLQEHNEEKKESTKNLQPKREESDAFINKLEKDILMFESIDRKPLGGNFENLDDTKVTDPIDPKPSATDLYFASDDGSSDYFLDDCDDLTKSGTEFEELECEVCKKMLNSKPEFDTHRRECKPKEKKTDAIKSVEKRKRNLQRTDCWKCKAKFPNRSEYLKHVRKCRRTKMSEITGVQRYFKKGEKKYTLEERTCTECGRVCANLSALRLHSKWHLDISERSYKCEICNKGFNTKSNLQHHLKFIHGPKICECDFCFEKFNSYAEKSKHQLAHSKEFKDLSAKVGNKKDAVLKHIELGNTENLVLGDNYNVPEGYWRCELCHKMLGGSYTRNQHLKFHEEFRPFVCEICGKSMVSQQVLDYHMLVHNNDRKFGCEKCGKKFFIAHHLKRHLQTSCNPEKKFQCSLCPKSFHKNQQLESHHLSLHSGVRPKDYSCDICGNKYSNKRSLQVHNRKHLPGDLDSLTCNICNGQFASIGSLKGHLKRHENKDKFCCEICGRRFSGRQDVKHHMKNRHSDKPKPTKEIMRCHICGKEYTKKAHLMTHINKHTEGLDS